MQNERRSQQGWRPPPYDGGYATATHGGQVGKKGRFLPSIVQQAIMSVLTTEHQTGLSV